jgi:hypothetical protein
MIFTSSAFPDGVRVAYTIKLRRENVRRNICQSKIWKKKERREYTVRFSSYGALSAHNVRRA